MNKKIEFSIPGFYLKEKDNNIFFQYFENNRDQFYDDIAITSCYDSFPCIWNGGRYVGGSVTDGWINDTILYYNQRHISLRFTFTNNQLKEEHLDNEMGNHILMLARRYGLIPNGITVASPILKEYLTNNYPDFYQVTSTTLAKNNLDEINELSKQNIVVPYYGLNNDFEKLEKLTNRDNIELLLCDLCIDNCPNRADHYNVISKAQLYGDDVHYMCPHRGKIYQCYVDTKKAKHYITIDAIREKYAPMGFTHFKIAGRHDSFVDLFEKYLDYFAKPEYKDRIRSFILNHYLNSD